MRHGLYLASSVAIFRKLAARFRIMIWTIIGTKTYAAFRQIRRRFSFRDLRFGVELPPRLVQQDLRPTSLSQSHHFQNLIPFIPQHLSHTTPSNPATPPYSGIGDQQPIKRLDS